MTLLTNGTEKIAGNPLLLLIARAAMVIAVPLLGWVGLNMVHTQAQMQEDLRVVQSDVKVLTTVVNLKLAGIYQATEAQRDFLIRDARIDGLKDRLEAFTAAFTTRLENHTHRLETLEKRGR